MNLRRYLEDSRAPRYSVLMALPLLLAYEGLSLALSDDGAGIRNGADVLIKWLFVSLGGANGLLWFNVILIAVAGALVIRDMRRAGDRLKAEMFAGMLLESALLALLVGVVVGSATQAVLPGLSLGAVGEMSIATRLMLSLGAGLYEELVFRVLLVGALAAIGTRLLGWKPRVAGVAACLLGALLFSAFHYIGVYGDRWELESFTFRFLAGLLFSGLYLTRGFGITAWTHALYDVYVMVI